MSEKKCWIPKPINEKLVKELTEELPDITNTTAKLLISIGITKKEQAISFLQPNFKTDLHNPGFLKEIKQVLIRIKQAIDNNENILIHGDYDADGITTVAIFVKAFEMLGVKVDYFLPNRFIDGYGINIDNVEMFSNYDLVISGDTGIKAFDTAYEVTHNSKTDLIVTDHHEPVVFPKEEKSRIPKYTKVIETDTQIMALPDCFATTNPKRIDDDYQSKDLSGAGVAFKVMEALFMYLKKPKIELYELTDFVACGLIPDMVPLFNTKQNSFEVRNLIKLGLSLMNRNPKKWVSAIKKEMNINKDINSTDLGFSFGPLLNAVGRLDDPTPAVEFLLEEDTTKLQEKAKFLVEKNKERQKLSRETGTKIIKELQNASEEFIDYGIVVQSDDLHIGITGLVAGDILKEFYRPTIALAKFEDKKGNIVYKGSGRSIEGLSVLEALIEVEKELGNYIYGGHEQAAGLTLLPEQIEPFRKLFREACKKQALKVGEEELFEPKEYFDLELQFEEINTNFLLELNSFEPFGMGNPQPIFYAKNVQIKEMLATKNDNCKRFNFSQNNNNMNGICFNKGKSYQKKYDELIEEILNEEYYSDTLNEEEKTEIIEDIKNNQIFVEILFTPQFNEFRGKTTIQLLIKDIIFKKKF